MYRLLSVILLLISSVSIAKEEISYQEFTKNKTLHQGYFSFYADKKTANVYLEIETFDQAFIFQSSLPHGIGSNDIGLDRGQLGDTRLVKFERVGNKVFLRQINTYYRANSKNILEKQSINEAFASSIIWGFKIANENKDGSKVTIDYTPFLLSDIHNLSQSLKKRKQGSFKIDASRSGYFKKRSKAFPDNTELEATVTFTGTGAGDYLKSVTPDANAVTVNLHHSLIRLPDDKYQTRAFHPYSGFWSVAHADYAQPIDKPLIQRVIPRHRLQKKNIESPTSEAIEPIVYYLDAGVPEPIKSALIDGALWWDQAFTAIGYKNAFQVKMLPEDADPMDVRYNVIQWVHRATRGWSYGASVIDPRTGEIIKGHVTLGSLRVRQDYLIALGLTSPFDKASANTSEMKAMALARIRQLSAHEVGHTLGIAHNFSASVNSRASVMDYPHPKITLNNGEIDLSKAYAENIGEWDKYVVAYGYSEFSAQESTKLAALVSEVQAKGLQYISDPDARPKSGGHASAHLWDNGSNPITELENVLKVRQVALNNFGINSIPQGTPLSEIEEVLVPIYNFHRYQVEAVAKLIAGVTYSYEIKNDNAPQGVQAVSSQQQSAALAALLKTISVDVLTLSPQIIALIPPKAYGYYRNRESFQSNTGLTFDPVTAAEANSQHTLSLLLHHERLARLAQQSSQDASIYNIESILSAIFKATIVTKPTSGLSSLIQQRVNQQVVTQLITLLHHDNIVPEVQSQILASILEMKEILRQQLKNKKYKAFHAHYLHLQKQIISNLENDEKNVTKRVVKLPPGSPIGN